MHRFLTVLAVLTLFFAPLPALAEAGWMPQSYRDAGWSELLKAEGDLNKDGVADIALVLEAPEGITEPGNWCDADNAFSQAPVRRLVIGFGDKAGGYSVVIDDPRVLLRGDEGGVFGNPLEDIAIDRGSVVISYFAGSRWRWGIGERFRYQDGGFYLIGLTEFSLDSASNASITYDYNPLSSKVLVSVEESPEAEMRAMEPTCIQCRMGEDCPQKDGCYSGTRRMGTGEKWFKVDRKPLINLTDYRCWRESTGLYRHTGFQGNE